MSDAPECWAVIPAAGIGQRMASAVPKQYLPLQGQTILQHAAHALLNHKHIQQVVFALHAEDQHFDGLTFTSQQQKIRTVVGGETRAQSVLNALQAIEADIRPDDFVLVHDAARPCLTEGDVNKLITACLAHAVGGILAVKVTDTIKQVEQSTITATLDRNTIWRAFTPQMFRFKLLYAALQHALHEGLTITDEASAVEVMGYQPCVVEGSAHNIKVTSPEDLALAAMYMDLR